jgi:hypothetical protein
MPPQLNLNIVPTGLGSASHHMSHLLYLKNTLKINHIRGTITWQLLEVTKSIKSQRPRPLNLNRRFGKRSSLGSVKTFHFTAHASLEGTERSLPTTPINSHPNIQL